MIVEEYMLEPANACFKNLENPGLTKLEYAVIHMTAQIIRLPNPEQDAGCVVDAALLTSMDILRKCHEAEEGIK